MTVIDLALQRRDRYRERYRDRYRERYRDRYSHRYCYRHCERCRYLILTVYLNRYGNGLWFMEMVYSFRYANQVKS